MDSRLPAHVEVSGILRQVQAAGGFAAVLCKGEREAGTILVICLEKGANAAIYERMPSLDGTRSWTLSKIQNADNPGEISEYCDRRRRQDSDLWIIELDIVGGERFIGLTPDEA